MKITMSRTEVLKVLEMEDVVTDICKALGKAPVENSMKDSMQLLYSIYDSFKASNKAQKAVKIHINFKSRENFLWIEINEQFMVEYMEIYYSYIKEVITPAVAIFKSTKKLIEKQKELAEKYNNF